MSKVAILQSNYIPWKGYFDLINKVDHFVLYDDVQYTKNDWRNRNIIKTKNGLNWLSIPVKKGSLDQLIQDSEVVDDRWRKKHWQTLKQNYSKTPFFNEYCDLFEELYLNSTSTLLSQINYEFISTINNILGIDTKIHWSKKFPQTEGKTQRLVDISEKLQCSTYISGPAAKDYLDEGLFKQRDIDVEWMDYSGYPEYQQVCEPFEHGVTILDLLFNTGPEARKYMKSF